MADQDFNINVRTTADLSGVKQTEIELRQLEAQTKEQTQAAQESGRLIGQLAGRFVGVAAIYELIGHIKTAAEQINKISDELNKQGAQLVENAQKYAEQAKSATTEADVIKIASSALKELQSTHKQVIESQKEELGFWDKVIDNIAKAVAGSAGASITGPLKEALELRKQQQYQIEEMARAELSGAIRTAKAYEDAFERKKAEPINTAIQEIVQHIRELEAQLKGIDYTKYPESWLATAKAIELAKRELIEFNQIQQKGQAAGVIAPAAPPRTVAEWRADQAKAMADFQRTQGPQAIADWRAQQAKAMAEFQGETPRFGGSSANDILTALKDQNTLLRQQIDLWK